MLTVRSYGLGTIVNIFLSLCKHFQLWANLYQHSTFELKSAVHGEAHARAEGLKNKLYGSTPNSN